MSRHRDVRNLNIHDELAEDEDTYDEEEEMTEEQKEQMDLGLAQARSVLGDLNDSGISDKQIKDALWDSFFDVEGTISWLLDQKAKQAAAAAKKAPEPDEATQPPLSALQRLALQRKQTAAVAGTGIASEKPSGLAGLVKGVPRKTMNPATQPQPKLDTPSIASVIPASVAPPPKTSKLSALAQKTAAQRAAPAIASPTPSTPSAVASKGTPLSKLALRIKAQKDAQEAASRPQPPIDAHRPEPNIQVSKPEFTLFGNLRPTTTPSPADSRANYIRKLKSGPSSFGDILVSKRNGADTTGPLARIYSEVIFAPSSAFQFNTPSPDDAVMAAREGTRLNAYKKASTVIGSRK